MIVTRLRCISSRNKNDLFVRLFRRKILEKLSASGHDARSTNNERCVGAVP